MKDRNAVENPTRKMRQFHEDAVRNLPRSVLSSWADGLTCAYVIRTSSGANGFPIRGNVGMWSL